MSKYKAKYAKGEVIDLIWDYGGPDYIYLRGHMLPGEASTIFSSKHYGPDLAFGAPQAKYARWSFFGDVSREDRVLNLKIYDESGRGRFPVMEAEVTRVKVV